MGAGFRLLLQGGLLGLAWHGLACLRLDQGNCSFYSGPGVREAVNGKSVPQWCFSEWVEREVESGRLSKQEVEPQQLPWQGYTNQEEKPTRFEPGVAEWEHNSICARAVNEAQHRRQFASRYVAVHEPF